MLLNFNMKGFIYFACFIILLSCSSGKMYFRNNEIVERTVTNGKTMRTEYYLSADSSCSSTGWGVFRNGNDVSLYLSFLNEKQSYYIDNDTQMDFLDYIIHDVITNNSDAALKSIGLNVRLLGTSGVEISNNYQQTIRYDKDLGICRSIGSNDDYSYLKKHHIYKIISRIMNKNGYEIINITNIDSYPYPIKQMKAENLIPTDATEASDIWDLHICLNLKKL